MTDTMLPQNNEPRPDGMYAVLDGDAVVEEFKEYLGFLNEWSGKHGEIIQNCYVSIGSDGLDVIFVTKGDAYRDELDDELAGLDTNLLDKFPHCPSDTMHIPGDPQESLNSFIDPDRCIQVYA